MTRRIPFHIWFIATACWVFSFFAITCLWLGTAGQTSGEDRSTGGLLPVTAVLLLPGLMGYWLAMGRRWVRWLFPLLAVAGLLAVLVAVLSPGMGPDAEERNRIGLTLPLVFFVASIGASAAVFLHFGSGEAS